MKYRKKPVVIEAILSSEVINRRGSESWNELPEWVRVAHQDGDLQFTDSDQLIVVTLEGVMFAGPADMLIRGVKGELYPCKLYIFEETYEPVTSDP